MKALIGFVLFAGLAFGQSSSVTLTWDDDVNPPSTTYRLYRAEAPCGLDNSFVLLQDNITEQTFDDTGLAAGSYCYVVAAVLNGTESLKSNQAQRIVLPTPPDLR